MSNIVLLVGGMGQELIRRSSHPPTPMWSAKVMMDEPEIVAAVHRDYIEAGAKVLILNTYSATPERLARDASEDLFKPLQAKAIEIALQAINSYQITIGGCLPPLFGSYRPEHAPQLEECLKLYRRIVAEQVGAVDVFICETMSSIKEVNAAVQAAAETGKSVWCAVSVLDEDGTRLRSGEPVCEAAAMASTCGAAAIMINCSWPEAVAQGLPELAKAGLPFGGFANGFTRINDLDVGGTVDVLAKRTDLDPDQYADHAMGWVEAGATIVGGCCEVGPAHITRLAQRLRDAGHTIAGTL